MDQPTTICFIGLGVMGGRMARRLVDAGHHVVVFDNQPSAIKALVDAGATSADRPADAAANSDIIMTSLPAGEQVGEVMGGQDGILAGVKPGSTLVDLSTIGPEWASRLAKDAASHGVTMLDAPVGGGWKDAEEGNLVIMVGGESAALDGVRTILEVLSSALFHFGGPGTGQAAKLALNMSQAVMTVGAAEAVRLLRALGADLPTFLETLESLDANPWFQRPLRHTIEGAYPAGFRVSLALKDARLATQSGKSAGVSLPGGELARDLLNKALDAGMGEEHFSAIVKLYDADAPKEPKTVS